MKKLFGVVSILFTLSNLAVLAQDSSSKCSDSARSQVGIGEAVELGHPIQSPDPIIPAELRKKAAAVVLSGRMTTEGAFENLSIAGGTSELGDAALNAVRQWRYTPSTKSGEPVNLDVYVTLKSDKGKISSIVEAALPFPTEPHTSIKQQVAKGELFYHVPRMKYPRAIYSPDPEYSEAARAVQKEGVVVLGMILEADGTPGDIWVERKVGLGLDQQAVKCVHTWKFQPATQDGKPLPIVISIEVNYHLH